MILTTTEKIPGAEVVEILGVVKGSTVRAKWFGKDLIAGLRHIVGGEIKEYTEMLTEARDEAMRRMIEEAERLGADAVINVRFTTSQIAQNASEILVYGTAVRLAAPVR